MKIVFATSNDNKLKEVKLLLKEKFNIISLKDLNHLEEIPEPFETIEENSAHKAKVINELYNLNVMAEDTGLEVKALNNEPGVYSARYAGEPRNAENNMSKLLENLKNEKQRDAHFKTVFTLIYEGKQVQFTGILSGEIAEKRSGNNGFGYDPVFIPTNYTKSLAEFSDKKKSKISHRAIAFNKLVEYLMRECKNA